MGSRLKTSARACIALVLLAGLIAAIPTDHAVAFDDPPASPVVAIAGDIACDPADTSFNGGLGTPSRCRQMATSDLLVGAGLAAVLTLGDHQYECGGGAAWAQSYDPSWGRVKNITRPSVGHHEYDGGGTGTDCDPTNDGKSYWDYFNGVGNVQGPAGDRGEGWYSFDVGSWHIISLNSVCSAAGGCNLGSPQILWLQQDLNTSSAYCTLAYMHGPRWSTAEKASNPALADMYQVLYAAGADVIVGGHAHNYQRFAPQDPNANLDLAHGLRQFVVGTGGKNMHEGDFLPGVPNWEVFDDTSFGVLKLTLNPTGYDWNFVPEVGGTGTFTDSGSQDCHAAPPVVADTEAPSVPSNVVATAAASAHDINLSWDASTDNSGFVAGYRVFRDGATTPIATVTSGLSYQDTGLAAGTTYSYTVSAFDAATPTANESATSSPPASATTPTLTWTTFVPVADSYVDSSAATTNYGTNTALRVDDSPTVRSYLRFNPSGLTGTVVGATLRVRADTAQSVGYDVFGVANTTWIESGAGSITSGNAPPLAVTKTGSSGPVAAGTWTTVDVTALIAGNGLVSLALTTPSSTALKMQSRENTYKPELIVTTSGGAGPDTTAPSVPTGVVATAAGASQINLSWAASTDNSGFVAGYRIYRNGATTPTATVTSGLSYQDTGLPASTTVLLHGVRVRRCFPGRERVGEVEPARLGDNRRGPGHGGAECADGCGGDGGRREPDRPQLGCLDRQQRFCGRLPRLP